MDDHKGQKIVTRDTNNEDVDFWTIYSWLNGGFFFAKNK